jgi:hypothetical protein
MPFVQMRRTPIVRKVAKTTVYTIRTRSLREIEARPQAKVWVSKTSSVEGDLLTFG